MTDFRERPCKSSSDAKEQPKQVTLLMCTYKTRKIKRNINDRKCTKKDEKGKKMKKIRQEKKMKTKTKVKETYKDKQ